MAASAAATKKDQPPKKKRQLSKKKADIEKNQKNFPKKNVSEKAAKKRKHDSAAVVVATNSKATKKAKTTTTATSKSADPKQSQRPRKHAEIMSQAKVLWNQLRIKGNSKEQIADLMGQLMPLIDGIMVDLCRQHDGARIVQAALQFGNVQQRSCLIQELVATNSNSGSNSNNTLAELAKSPYGHFCVLKAIKYGGFTAHQDTKSKDDNNNIANNNKMFLLLRNALKGNLPSLAVHATACRVVECLYTTLSPKQWRPLYQELYGPHVKLFLLSSSSSSSAATANMSSLKACLAAACQEGQQQQQEQEQSSHNIQKSTLDFVGHLVHKGMEKNLYALTYFQYLLNDYQLCLSGQQIRDVILHSGSLSSTSSPTDSAIQLLSSREGVQVVGHWIAYGTAKDRKAILKSLKGFGRSGLLHSHAYLAFLQLTRLTDDTVLLYKNFLQELLTAPPSPTSSASSSVDIRDKTNKKGTDKADNDADNHHDASQHQQQQEQHPTPHPLLDLALSETASKLFLLILLLDSSSNDSSSSSSSSSSSLHSSKPSSLLQKLLDPYECQVLDGVTTGTVPTLDDGQPTSKKDMALKRQELLQNYLQEPLLQLCIQHARELLLSRPGSLVLQHVYQALSSSTSGNDGVVGEPKLSALVNAVVQAVMTKTTAVTLRQDNKSDDDDDNDNNNNKDANDHEQDKNVEIFQDKQGHYSIKHLIMVDVAAETAGENKNSAPSLLFSKALVEALLDAKSSSITLTDLALSGNRGAFVVAALYKVKAVRPLLRRNLDKKKLEQQAAAAKKKKNTNNKKQHQQDGDNETPSPSSSLSSFAGIQALLKEMAESTE